MSARFDSFHRFDKRAQAAALGKKISAKSQQLNHIMANRRMRSVFEHENDRGP